MFFYVTIYLRQIQFREFSNMIMRFSKRSPQGSDLPLLPHHKTFLANLCVPLIVFLEGFGAENEALSPEASARRRRLCAGEWVTMLTRRRGGDKYTGTDVLIHITKIFGTMLGLTMDQAAQTLTGGHVKPNALAGRTPTVVPFLHFSAHYTADRETRKVEDWVLSDPFLGPVYRSCCCTSCGLLPGKIHQQFQVCSLCKDPAVGQFCCKDPCFAAFWRGGHKNTCVGRDKVKKKGKGGGGGGGDGGGGGGGAGGSSGATGS
jgi:uncharacterized membrane protein YgcG